MVEQYLIVPVGLAVLGVGGRWLRHVWRKCVENTRLEVTGKEGWRVTFSYQDRQKDILQ
jgi:hypothetical protein